MKTNQENPTHQNINLYKWYVLFAEPLFWGPILIQAIMNLGKMTLPQIYFLEGIVMLLIILLNIPTGALADIIGRKKTLIIGQVFLLLSFLGFAFMSEPWHVWTSNALWAIGYSFQTGSDHALIYQTLKKTGQEKLFTQIEGKFVGSRYILIACCSLLVGPLAKIDLRLPLYCCLPFVAIPLVISFFLKEERVINGYSAKKQLETLKQGTLFVFRKPEVWWIVGFVSLIGGASKIWFFTYNPYFEGVGVKIQYYGVVFFLLNLAAWFFSHHASNIENRFSERFCIIGMICCIGLPILLMGIFPFWFMTSLVLIQNIVRGFMRPFTSNFINRHIDSEDIRATALSTKSTFEGAFGFLSLMGFGLLNSSLGLFNSMILLGIIVLVLGALNYRQYLKLFPKKY
jgi:MFS family permease